MNLLKKLILPIILSFACQLHAHPNIVVTINPLYALVASVCEGVTSPELLLGKNNSPHDFVLKPSDARKLTKADIIFMVDAEFEQFLDKIIQTYPKSKIVELAKNPAIKLLAARPDSPWEDEHEHTDGDDHDHHGHHHGLIDYHIWTDPNNAKLIVEHIRKVLTEKDPQNSKNYLANSKKVLNQLTLLDAQLSKELKPYQESGYLVFHDAYQYFERHYQMKALGAVSINPNSTPGAKKIKQLKQIIKQQHAVCLFSEPNFSHKMVDYISASTKIRTGVLDVEWGEDDQHYNGYISMMLNLKNNLLKCLRK